MLKKKLIDNLLGGSFSLQALALTLQHY